MGICAQDEKQKLSSEATANDIRKSRMLGKKEMERIEELLREEIATQKDID